MGHTFTFKTKTTLLITLLAKIPEKIFNQKRIQKEKYEMKGENKKENTTKINETKLYH